MPLERPRENRQLLTIALALAVVALGLALYATFRPAAPAGRPTANESALARTLRTKILRAGYSNFHPYTIINPNVSGTGRVSGFCVDMVNEIVSRQTPPWSVEWHQVTFETLKADMESGRFDVFADAVYQTMQRASEFGVTIPYSYFGVAVALVRKNETRFKQFTDLDQPNITIALAEGWTSTEYARQHLKKAQLRTITVGSDPFIPFQDVMSGKADAALQDVPTVEQFARAHPNQVKALWVNHPPTRVPAGFMTRQGETDMLRFLDASIHVLEADGTIDNLNKKWSALSEFPALNLTPGAGLSEQ
ncbi:MAG: amino acid ABC transporter substrate-binding protein [Acidobacteriaceae bacterium]|nr:amino acid ABC transporter substrate-binding protein [Acidobacteriaceae bacterium]